MFSFKHEPVMPEVELSDPLPQTHRLVTHLASNRPTTPLLRSELADLLVSVGIRAKVPSLAFTRTDNCLEKVKKACSV
jgi:hypothetical protein